MKGQIRASIRSRRFTIRGFLETLEDVIVIALVGVTVYAVLSLLYSIELDGVRLLNVSEVISLVVAELPLGFGLWWLLGERSRGRVSDAKDNIELWKEYGHLVIHYWYLLGSRLGTLYYIVENPDTKMAYDSPRFLGELATKGIIHRVRHKNEVEMRKYLSDHEITLIEREATFVELRP